MNFVKLGEKFLNLDNVAELVFSGTDGNRSVTIYFNVISPANGKLLRYDLEGPEVDVLYLILTEPVNPERKE